jgi:uncharacterized cofD-like protein
MRLHDIVTIGNGTGQGVILRALRKITDLDRVSALIGVTDNGGHSGALRREMNIPSVGDVKTVISALTGETVWGQLFRHRFNEGRLTGVSMGNLIMAALVDAGGSLYHATRRLTQALDIKAHIIPISDVNAQVVAELSDGSEVTGEWESITRQNQSASIVGIHHTPELIPNPEALKALKSARFIIICPGTLWLGTGSILAVEGIREIISESTATIVAVGNVLTQPGVSDHMTAVDHLVVLEDMLGRPLDFYLQHDKPLPDEVLSLYRAKGFEPIQDDLGTDDQKVIRGELISQEFIGKTDRVHFNPERGYPHAVRHDPSLLAEILIRVAGFTPGDEKFASKPREERWEVKDF